MFLLTHPFLLVAADALPMVRSHPLICLSDHPQGYLSAKLYMRLSESSKGAGRQPFISIMAHRKTLDDSKPS
eukprot:5586347-Amphidinium_carterae.1